MSSTWLKAWGKLPSSSPLAGSISSASCPRSLAWPSSRSNSAVARRSGQRGRGCRPATSWRLPAAGQAFPIGQAKNKNLTVKMSNCNHRHYLPELVTMTRSGAVDPSKVLTQVDDVLGVIEAYEVFDRREPTWINAALDPRA